jgi:hypothetical protein
MKTLKEEPVEANSICDISEEITHLEAMQEKRKRQKLYADNMPNIPAGLARGSSYGKVRISKNSLVKFSSMRVINMNNKESLKELLKNDYELHNELLSVFKKEELAMSWLTSPKVPLENMTPLSLIATVDGKNKVLDMIYRIKTGDFS